MTKLLRAGLHTFLTSPTEARLAPDGVAYSKSEFIEFFGNEDEWNTARGRAHA